MSGFRKLSAEERETFEREASGILRELHAKAREEIEAGETIPAMMYVMTIHNDVELVMLQHAMDAGKDVAEALIKGIQGTPGVLATVFMSEAWMVELPKDEVDETKPFPQPSKHPKRIEAVVWVVESPVGDLFARAKISRNPDRLGDLDVPKFDPDSTETQGRFVGGFKNVKPEQYKHGAVTSTLLSHFNRKGKQ